VDYRDERATQARDYGLELAVGAKLKTAGFDVSFGEGGDLSVRFKGRQVFLECKRPQTLGKLESRVRKAHRQLGQRYEQAEDPKTCRGIVAISATKMINAEARRVRVDSWPELAATIDTLSDRFIAAHNHRWVRADDPRTIGALIEFRFMAWVCDRAATAGNLVADT